MPIVEHGICKAEALPAMPRAADLLIALIAVRLKHASVLLRSNLRIAGLPGLVRHRVPGIAKPQGTVA